MISHNIHSNVVLEQRLGSDNDLIESPTGVQHSIHGLVVTSGKTRFSDREKRAAFFRSLEQPGDRFPFSQTVIVSSEPLLAHLIRIHKRSADSGRRTAMRAFEQRRAPTDH